MASSKGPICHSPINTHKWPTGKGRDNGGLPSNRTVYGSPTKNFGWPTSFGRKN